MIDYINFTITRAKGTVKKLSIEINYEANSINVPPSGDLIGQENIAAFMDTIQRAATLLALGQEAKKNGD